MIGTAVIGAGIKAACSFIFDNPIGKSMAAGSLVVGAFFLWLWTHDAKVAAQAQDQLAAQINTHTEKITNDGLKAREGASQPGSWDRLRRHHCRDCD